MINSAVLVLNQSYQPLNICRVRRAVILIWLGKAEILENGTGEIHTPNFCLPLPSVIRLAYMVKRPYLGRKLTRREVFRRDNYTCQYCGREIQELTVDHVAPRYLGGKHTWENVVSACRACNRRKAGLVPEEAGMRLLRKPFAPPVEGYYIASRYLQIHPGWEKFISCR